MLKMTKIELELISDPDMYLFLMDTIRGGISICNKKHVIADNKYINKTLKMINISYIWMQIIYTDIQCFKSYHIKISNGLII